MGQWLDSNINRALAYGLAGAASLHAGLRERARARAGRDPMLWPAFWYLTAGLLAAMAAARLLEIDDLITEFGRSRARLAGWYRTRRGLQATLVGSVSAVWVTVVFVAIWRVPERRRRYLPAAVVVFTMICFAAVRLVSLHQADALLYHRSIGTVRVVAIVEYSLIALGVLATYWHPLVRSRVHARVHAAARDHPRPAVGSGVNAG